MRKTCRAILTTLILVSAVASHAEAPEAPSLQAEWFPEQESLSESLASALRSAGSRSQSVSSTPWKKAPYVVGATALLWAYDEDIQAWAQKNRSHTTNRIAYYAKNLGHLKFMVRPLGAVFLYGTVADDERAADTAVWSAEAITLGGMATHMMKNSFQRPRPSAEPAEDPFGLPETGVSFPSGHSTVAFAVATIVASQYRGTSAMAYSVASLTALSRVNDNVHWASDIVFGAFVGYVSAKTILRYELQADAPPEMQTRQACPLQVSFTY